MKRWIFILLALLIVGTVLFFYVSFNGNFITKAVAKQKVETYVAEQFTDATTNLVASGYNFKDSRYYFLYMIHTDTTQTRYTFEIGGPVLLDERIYSYMDLADADEAKTESFQQAGTKWLQTMLQNEQLKTDFIGYTVDIPRGLYDENKTWTPTVDALLRPSIAIELTDIGQSEAEFDAQAERIQAQLEAASFTYTNLQIQVWEQIRDGKETYMQTKYTHIYP